MHTKYVNRKVIGVVCLFAAFAVRVAHAQGSTDRCSLLTQAAVSAAAGVSVDAGKPIDTRGCSWESGKPHVIVTVTFMGSTMSGVFTKESPGVTTVHLGGIGDDAVYVTAANVVSLYVKHAKDILLVRVYGIPDADKQKSIERTLALNVLKNL